MERKARRPELLYFENKHLVIAYRSPFQKLPPPSAKLIEQSMDLGMMPPANLPHGLDIWRHWFLVPLSGGMMPKTTKVLNLVWNEDGIVVVSYKAGRWEQELERLAASI
jgi:hypothetical protein